MTNKSLSLFELNSLVREVIESEMTREYWVEAELSEVRTSRGHCYMELVQKDEESNTPTARASAKCWRSQWSIIEPSFIRITGEELHAGMKVCLKVYAQFHEAFGFSWIVTDIDPMFTLGALALRRQKIIQTLREEGVYDLQKLLTLPLFCQRIAVISSETAAGYGDFSDQLARNEDGLQFRSRLFPAIMQGEQVEASIIAALNRIYEEVDSFDCVVIIRGGGATADMSGFDTLALAENVAQFPLPIITGIGHDRDESVLDMVSHTKVKTPTAAAAFLIAHLKQVYDQLCEWQERIGSLAKQRLISQKTQLQSMGEIIPRLFSVVRLRHETRIDALSGRLSAAALQRLAAQRSNLENKAQRIPMLLERKLTAEGHRLDLLAEKTRQMDPAVLLKRGYSITLFNGHSLRDTGMLHAGCEVETRVENGTFKSIVK